MQFTKEEAKFTQNNQNFYVGDIESDDTIMFKDDFIVIGSVRSQKNIIAAEGLIVMGDITSKSIYVYRDLLCTGKIISQLLEVEGTLRELDKSSLKLESNIEIQDTFIEKESTRNTTRTLFEKGLIKDSEEDIDVNKYEEAPTVKNNVIKERENIKLYDKVRHRVYGTGIITNLTTKGIYIEFHSGQVKRLDLNKVLAQGLLKKELDYSIDKSLNHEKEFQETIINKSEEKKLLFNNEEIESDSSNEQIPKNNLSSKKDKKNSRECISPAKEMLRKSNIVTNLEKIRIGSVVIHETLGEGTIEDINTRRITVDFLEGGISSLDAKLILKLKVMKVKKF